MIATPILAPFRRIAYLFAFASVTAIPSFAQSVFVAVPSTPYDQQMARIYPVLNCAPLQWPNRVSCAPINLWMMQLRALPYHYSRYWQTPLEVNLAQASDCKGKAVALYGLMRQNGVRNLRIVIGKRHLYDAATHAWLEWQTTTGSYVLDPTWNESPVPLSQLDPVTYVPLYAYDDAHKYHATNMNFIAPTTAAAPAAGDRVFLPTPSAAAPEDRQLHSRRSAHTTHRKHVRKIDN